jgi:hypothetical protein
MNPLNIPDSASSVTFTMSMDLTDIIVQYTGKNNLGDNLPHDDPMNVFVIANNFWERLSLSINFN